MKLQFFIVVAPGWEDELLNEIREIEPFLLGPDGRPSPEGLGEIRVDHGGLSLQAEVSLVLQIHFFSKLASRILLRLKKFEATEFFQVEKGLKSLDLKPWLAGKTFQLKIEAQKSKINNEKRILEVAEKVWSLLIQKSADDLIQIRNVSDQFTISLDLTGEHLHRRDLGRTLGGPAPIRETLAALLLRFLIQGEPISVLNQVTLIDPMAGSGTLLSEANHLYRPLSGRKFSFQSQPWIPKLLKSESFIANYRHVPTRTWKALVALDSWPEARDRLERLKSSLNDPLSVYENPNEIPVQESTRRWVIANPPYGERLKAIEPSELRQILLASDPERVSVILPERLALALKKSWDPGWKIDTFAVQNGGIPCFLIRFLKKI